MRYLGNLIIVYDFIFYNIFYYILEFFFSFMDVDMINRTTSKSRVALH